jgi:serine phosphatase RsbU (regulator of sigma subunit)
VVSEREAAELLHAPPAEIPARVAEHARRLAGCDVGVYVIDIDGSCLVRLAGGEAFPAQINARLGVGPEIPLECIPEVQEVCSSRVPGSAVQALIVRDRAIGVLLSERGPQSPLGTLAAEAALAIELNNGYTDIVHSARRRKEIEPAAEIQQNLLPPRLARLADADLACGVLPGYDVAGDFFDYAGNADGLWLCVADAMGKGNEAAALSSLAVGALRSARRGGSSLEQVAAIVQQATAATGSKIRFLTAVLAHWHPSTRLFRWIDAGHPPPLLVRADGSAEELADAVTYPFGLDGEREFRVAERRLAAGERVLLYSDGTTERQRADGTRLGLEGLLGILSANRARSAATLIRALQEAVEAASPKPLRDDATMLLLAPCR